VSLRLRAKGLTLATVLLFVFGRLLFALHIHLKRPNVVHHVPRLGRRQTVCKRGHRCAIQSSHKNAIKVLVRLAALEARPYREIVGRYRIASIIYQRLRGWTIPTSLFAMARPAVHFLVQLVATLNALLIRCRL